MDAMVMGMRIPALCLLLAAAAVSAATLGGADKEKAYSGPACMTAPDDFFVNRVWTEVGAQSCLKCHKEGGDAEDSDFVLSDPERSQGTAQDAAMRQNRDAFVRMAQRKSGDQYRLLLKVVGRLKHGGKDVLTADSEPYHVLAEFVRRTNAPKSSLTPSIAQDISKEKPFFDGVKMLDDRQLLRRVTLSLAGRLPTPQEQASLAEKGHAALDPILDSLMKEDAFYDRLREGFNDIFLTVGFDGVPETALSYEHFSHTRGWVQNYDLSSIADPKERQKERYKIGNDYNKAILGEPMKLIEYIVRNNRPFTEIVTADYTMITPYTARGYGIYDEIKNQFKNPDDPFEYIPVRLKSLIARTQEDDEITPTGYYAHAGLLSNFEYLKRYPTTETNRNRQRARVFYLQFLGIDVLELAPRSSDAAAVQAKFAVPTMQAPECVVCHKIVDPVAGCFQDYWKFEGIYGPRKGGWFKDMFQPGFEGENLPEDQRWRALQWLGEKTAKDPRFATAMVEHVYYILTGRKVLKMPKDLEDPMYAARLRAYQEQRKTTEAIAVQFAKDGFNLKDAFKGWIASDFYRADGLSTAHADPARSAELEDLGIVRMLAPEQVERKINAVFGRPWGKLTDQMAMLYGGIDSKEVTERAADPSGAMGAIQRIMANDVACRETAFDFSLDPSKRVLFPEIEPDVLPGVSAERDLRIRKAIAYLHQRILGRYDAPDSPEVDRSFKLFSEIIADAAKNPHLEKSEIYSCRQGGGEHGPTPDPYYTIRAWRSVVTYLLRRPEFLYE